MGPGSTAAPEDRRRTRATRMVPHHRCGDRYSRPRDLRTRDPRGHSAGHRPSHRPPPATPAVDRPRLAGHRGCGAGRVMAWRRRPGNVNRSRRQAYDTRTGRIRMSQGVDGVGASASSAAQRYEALLPQLARLRVALTADRTDPRPLADVRRDHVAFDRLLADAVSQAF